MSNKIGLPAIQSQLDSLQSQIDSIERGQNIDFSQSNYVLLSSTILDPNTGLYNGTEGQIIDKYVSNTANIDGSKLKDNSIDNIKLMSIDGSKIINNTITNQQISNGTINNLQIAGNADIEQSKILNLPNDLSNINLNITTLQNYFFNSRLKLSNLTKSTNNYQVLSQDGSANDPAYRQLDSNYISSLDQSKINQNNNNQYVKYCDSINYNNVTTFINSLSNGFNALIYPFNNIGGGYTITNNDTWQAINCNISGFPEKGVIAQSVIIDSATNTNILNIGNGTNIYGQYYSNLQIRSSQTNIRIFLNGYFENMQFQKVNLTIANNSFCLFYNCTFNDVFNVVSAGTGSTIFLFNCNFTSKTWTQTTNNGSFILSNCSNLPSFTLLSGWFLTGINGTTTQTQLNVSNKGFYDTATNTKYLYVSSDINSNAGILGSQLSSTAGITSGQITSLNSDKININSNLNMGSFKVSTTNNIFTNNDYITKAYGDSTYSSGAGFASLNSNNIFTGTNTFNNSVFIQDATTNNNPLSYGQFLQNNMLQSYFNLPYINSVSFWFDFNDRSLMYINQLSSTDTTEKVGNINNKQPDSYNFSLTSTLGGSKWPTLLSGSFGINTRNYLNFNASIGQTLMLVCSSWAYDNAPLQQCSGFIVFRPLNSTINGQILFSGDYGTQSTRINVKFLSSSGRNGWTDTTNVYVALNCGTVNGLFTNGWYALHNGLPATTSANAIKLSQIINKTCILFFSYTTKPVTLYNLNKSCYCMNARFSCPSAGIPIDTIATAGDITCLYQDAVNTWFNIGALCPNPMTNTLNQEGSFDIMEMILYNAPITDTQRQNITTYLSNKWNVV